MEQKSIQTEIKASADGTFEGYASVFGNVDSYGDIVMAGAYAKTIQERKSKIRLLWNHDSHGLPIGTLTDLAEDSKGLKITAKFSSTTLAQDVRTLMGEGAIDSMSVGYQTIKATYGETEAEYVRYLNELKLYEVSAVLMPANELAVITGSKNLSHLERTITQLDDLISVGIKSGRPLSAENLTRLQNSYTQLHALLQAKSEPSVDTPVVLEAALQDTEPPTHSEDLLTELKAFTPSIQAVSDEARILAEIKGAFAFIHTGVNHV